MWVGLFPSTYDICPEPTARGTMSMTGVPYGPGNQGAQKKVVLLIFTPRDPRGEIILHLWSFRSRHLGSHREDVSTKTCYKSPIKTKATLVTLCCAPNL